MTDQSGSLNKPIFGSKEASPEGQGEEATTQPIPNLSDLMNFIIYNLERNCVNFRHQCEALVKTYNPSMVLLLLTKMVNHKHLIELLYLNSHLESSVTGHKGGIVIMWKEDIVKL